MSNIVGLLAWTTAALLFSTPRKFERFTPSANGQVAADRVNSNPITHTASAHRSGIDSSERKVFSVDSIKVVRVGATARLVVRAYGKASTPHWSHARLVRQLTPPEGTKDSALTFSFVARPPSGIVNQLVTPIHTKTTTMAPRWARYVRVCASQEPCVTKSIPR